VTVDGRAGQRGQPVRLHLGSAEHARLRRAGLDAGEWPGLRGPLHLSWPRQARSGGRTARSALSPIMRKEARADDHP
jgi:hypothetical protein